MKIKRHFGLIKTKRVFFGFAAILFVGVFFLNNGKGSAFTWTQYSESFRRASNVPADMAYISTDCNGLNKGCISVWKFDNASLGCHPKYCGTPTWKYYPGVSTNFYFSGQHSGASAICITARSQIKVYTDSNEVSWELRMTDGSPGGSGTWNIPQTKTYADYCSFFYLAPGTHNGVFTVRHQTPSGSQVYVFSGSLRW